MDTFYRVEYSAYGFGWNEHTTQESLSEALESIEWMKEDYDEGDIAFRIFKVTETLEYEDEK